VKVIHVPYTFAPDPVGGTEIYVEGLARSLWALGIQSVISAPCTNGTAEAYEHTGLRVRRFRSATESPHLLRELYGGGDPEAAAAFARILDEERPDAVHLHAFTRGVSILLVRAAKQRGLPVFFTYHTPTVSCQRGTLMLRGKGACDGALDVRRCTGCSLQGLGLPPPIADLLSHMPLRFARALELAEKSGGFWTALRMPELIRAGHVAVRALFNEVDAIVALKQWIRDLLLRNQVPGQKIVLCEHGLPAGATPREQMIDSAVAPLRVAFLGRADPVKGADTLVRAIRSSPGLDVEVDFYGLAQSTANEQYWSRLQQIVHCDPRMKFLPAVPPQEVVRLLRQYHLLAVPSRSLETGPLVVLEAFAAGASVIGANLPGIANWVIDGKNGILLDPQNVTAWAAALRRCVEDRAFLATLRRDVKRPRRMTEVADDMARLYSRYVSRTDKLAEQRAAFVN
jgi:glycosyltransferase involved in cell wall biosynthesis